MTNSQSQFLYIVDENVIFLIGDIVFPTLVGQKLISLLGVPMSHMIRLLQTLDEYGFSGDGIRISVQAHNQTIYVVVDFSSVVLEQQVVDVVPLPIYF
jgi:hypothetical protein